MDGVELVDVVQHDVGDTAVEFPSRFFANGLDDLVVEKGIFVHAHGQESIIEIDDGQDARSQGNVVAFESRGITCPVVSLVMAHGDVTGHAKHLQVAITEDRIDGLGTDGRMTLYDLEIVVGEFAFLLEHPVGDTDLANVVEG